MANRLSIAHVVHSLEPGGLENGVVNLLNLMDSTRFDHMLICLTRAGSFAERITNKNVTILELGCSGQSFRFPVLKLRRLFRELNVDVVHTRGWGAVDAVFAASMARVKAIVHGEHGREWTDTTGAHWKRNQIRRIIGRLVKRYVIVSEFFRPWLTRECGVTGEKIVYIPNGVDTGKFYPLDARGEQGAGGREQGPESSGPGAESWEQKATGNGRREEQSGAHFSKCGLRQRLGLPADGIWIGSVGRLDPVKDYSTVLKALAELTAEFPTVRLAVAGDGPQHAQLRGLAEKLGISSAVYWLGSRSDMPDVYRAFDMFVQCSLFEGMSNTILEAMATGLPIVATDTGGNSELVKNGRNGALIPVGDVSAVVRAVGAYLHNPALRTEHGFESRRRVEVDFDLSLMAARYADLYESISQ